MLDEEEFATISELYSDAIQGTKRFRETSGADIRDPRIGELFRPVCDKYEQLTGFKEANANAIMHHRLALYGPACKHCGKPLRSANAKHCGNCMQPVEVV